MFCFVTLPYLKLQSCAQPDEKWGEVPWAFVTLKPDCTPPSESDLIEFCKNNMARYKAPKKVIFGELPKTIDRERFRNIA